ncbi:nucleotidyltransferase domain-containing protein [Jeotgalibacillus sp. S-D1]|uniref:nucleotidyltransferase domain-containing protein n=1 Tax=Jeotgalibacillus sp. S-D1 TaxID=2552189 RepID=UPI0010599FD3|nr:nucleotidyltransferase domain-containing protein [Jeotgalibacillus sp. S-D1]TDL30860.1 nucleotidyltransferase domain-containing protein [Jeotgalibacillus sp. S-D1]
MNIDREQPIEAAKKFIEKKFPKCKGALLAGSVVRGEETSTSDLDIVVFDPTIASSYRESLMEFGWPIELFVHNLHSYKKYFASDCKRATPSMPQMVAEGIVIRDEGAVAGIKEEAIVLLENGPAKWTEETVRLKRYFITDALDDFTGSKNRSEALFIAGTLASLVSEFILRTNLQWIGDSKWMVRALKKFDRKIADEFVYAFDQYYTFDQKEYIVRMTKKSLEPYGGLLFAGFSLGKS